MKYCRVSGSDILIKFEKIKLVFEFKDFFYIAGKREMIKTKLKTAKLKNSLKLSACIQECFDRVSERRKLFSASMLLFVLQIVLAANLIKWKLVRIFGVELKKTIVFLISVFVVCGVQMCLMARDRAGLSKRFLIKLLKFSLLRMTDLIDRMMLVACGIRLGRVGRCLGECGTCLGRSGMCLVGGGIQLGSLGKYLGDGGRRLGRGGMCLNLMGIELGGVGMWLGMLD